MTRETNHILSPDDLIFEEETHLSVLPLIINILKNLTMNNIYNIGNPDPRNKNERNKQGYEEPAHTTPRKEGGEDSLAETSPQDTKADEKIIVNEQREDKIVNVPSQTAAHTSELEANDDDVI